MTFAKNVTSGYLPLGGVMVSDEISDVLAAGGAFWHGFTTSGHPVCCAAGVANLNIIMREKLVERVRDDIGPYLKSRWMDLADHPLVGEVRMVGLLGGLELTPDRATRARFEKFDDVGSICRDFAYARGLILRATGSTMLTAPPYVLGESEADTLVDIARAALDDTQDELKRRGWL
jgi:putrescine aminotransferase